MLPTPHVRAEYKIMPNKFMRSAKCPERFPRLLSRRPGFNRNPILTEMSSPVFIPPPPGIPGHPRPAGIKLSEEDLKPYKNKVCGSRREWIPTRGGNGRAGHESDKHVSCFVRCDTYWCATCPGNDKGRVQDLLVCMYNPGFF